jgi:hypothetical protein
MLSLNGEPISDGIIRVRLDIVLPVDHLRQAAQLVVDVLRFIGKQQARHDRRQVGSCHRLHRWPFVMDEDSLILSVKNGFSTP